MIRSRDTIFRMWRHRHWWKQRGQPNGSGQVETKEEQRQGEEENHQVSRRLGPIGRSRISKYKLPKSRRRWSRGRAVAEVARESGRRPMCRFDFLP